MDHYRSVKRLKAMTLEQFVRGVNPVFQIADRLGDECGNMSAAETLFWKVNYFIGDTLNGSLHQSLSNSTGDLFYEVFKFVRQYCQGDCERLFEDIEGFFPGGRISEDRDERWDHLAGLSLEKEAVLGNVTDRFYSLCWRLDLGLLVLVIAKSNDFNGICKTLPYVHPAFQP